MAYRCIFSIVTDRLAVVRPYLTVLAADPCAVVESAGGLIYDRVRQGWRVTIHVPAGADTLPLRVLGADIDNGAPERDLRTAVLTSAELYTTDRCIRSEVEAALATKTTEVLLWGTAADLGALRSVTHRLSAAALAFKARALLSAALPATTVEPTEAFRTACALDVIARGLDVAG